MTEKIESPKYTVRDVYAKAAEMLDKDLEKMSGRPLTDKEKKATENIAKVISQGVLKNMGVI